MKINVDRVIKDIETLARFTATPGNGVTRLSFTEEMKVARDYIVSEMKAMNLKIWEDGYSNLFGRREGNDPYGPIIMIGSHYDSVINAGPFDGVAGLVAALEVVRVLNENGFESSFPIEVVAMNDEEGVRFGGGVANSRAMAGLIEEKNLDDIKDSNNISLRQAMTEYGIVPDLKDAIREKGSLKAFVELHIEQGPILEQENKDIGLVETIVGLDRYNITFKGKAGHAGTTPMDNRRDALLAASEFILEINKIVKQVGGGTVGTVGELELSPNASNVIPQQVTISVDVRSTNEENIKAVAQRINETLERIKLNNIEIKLEKGIYVSPVNMSDEIVDTMENVSKEFGHSYMRMNSGAGHDAMIMAGIAPTGMIFVPSKNGLSHHPDEWTDYDQLEKGIEVLLQTVVALSR